MARANHASERKRLQYNDQATISPAQAVAAAALLIGGVAVGSYATKEFFEDELTHAEDVHNQKLAEKQAEIDTLRSYMDLQNGTTISKRAQLLAQKSGIDLRCIETYEWGCKTPIRQYTSDNTSRDAPYVGKHPKFELKQEINQNRFSGNDELVCNDEMKVLKGGGVSANVQISNHKNGIKSAALYVVNRTTGDIEGDIAVISDFFRSHEGHFGADLSPLRAGPKEVHMLLSDHTGVGEEFRLGQPFYMVGSDVEFACDDDHPTTLTPLSWTPKHNGTVARTEPGYMRDKANGDEIIVRGSVEDADGIRHINAVLKRGVEEVKNFTKVHAGATNVSINLPFNELPSGQYDLKLTIEDMKGNKRIVKSHAPFNLVDPAQNNLTRFEGAEIWQAFESLEDALNGTQIPVLDCRPYRGFVTSGRFLKLDQLRIEDTDAIKRVEVEVYTSGDGLEPRREFSGTIHRPLVEGQVSTKVHMPVIGPLEAGGKNTIITVEDSKGNKEFIQRFINVEDAASCDVK